MAQNPHGVIAQYGEMAAWFGSFDRYNSGNGGDRATWLIYDAGRHVVDRVKFDGKPLVVERAACSLLGAIATDALREPTGSRKRSVSDAVEQAVAYLDYAAKMFRRVTVGLEPTTADDDTYDTVALLSRRGLTLLTNSDIGREPGFRCPVRAENAGNRP